MIADSDSRTTKEPPGLLVAVADKARRTPPKQLEAMTVVSVLVIAVIAVLRPSWWEIGFPFAVVAAFGGWGLIEHNRRSSVEIIDQRRVAAASFSQYTLTAIGILSAIGALYALVGRMIGTVVS